MSGVRDGRPNRRTILHADMDAFFVSVELRRRPELVGQPVVVGGTGARGVVAAASYEARRYGVHSAMPSAVARRRCPQAVFLAGDHELYAAVSRDVREIFDRYTPIVEPLSLDEAFLDVTGSLALFGDGVTIGRSIRGAVRDELDLDCSVGVARNKFLAKLASVEAKPIAHPDRIEPGPGVVSVEPEREQEFLDRLPVSRLWGVGPATLDKLQRLGVGRVHELRSIGDDLLVAALGTAQARHLVALAVGRDERHVETDRAAKSISHEETFDADKFSATELDRELVRLVDGVARRLRAGGLGARTLQLKVRFGDFTTISRSTTTADVLDLAPDILAAVRPLLAPIDTSPGVRLLGVSGTNLGVASRQLSFDELMLAGEPTDAPDWASATVALDKIRERFGASAIGPASALEDGALRVVRPGEQQWGPNQRSDRAPR
ncbi:MAG: DNA polymerase IV [Ilumatobacteraceae bacterium]